MRQLEERIRGGVEWLDEERPGWYHDVDLQWLSFPFVSTCVLGQLGLWERFGETVGFGGQVANHGFNLVTSFRRREEGDPGTFVVDGVHVDRWTHLTNLWREVIIQKRRET